MWLLAQKTGSLVKGNKANGYILCPNSVNQQITVTLKYNNL